MTDHDLLELAARASGVGPILCYETARNCLRIGLREKYKLWRPLTDDGDALRLAASLNMGLSIHDNHCMACAQKGTMQTVKDIPTLEATRRAIVRAAAEVGKDVLKANHELL